MISDGRARGPISPANPNDSPSQTRRISPSIASNSRPRRWKSVPAASASSWRPPTATPSTSRPPEKWSSVAACLASTAPLWRSGASRIAVVSRTRSVTAATAASAISGS